jgi:uncharacterized protein (TIGR03118 family)
MKLSHFANCAAALLCLAVPAVRAGTYVQTNLASDIPGLAANTDANLKNSWGMSFGPTTPFWVSNQVSGNSTLYNGLGVPQSLIVTTPPSGIVPSGPTGQVFNSTASGFMEADGAKATFMFATLAGTIDAWNPGNGTTAVPMITDPGSTYTGLGLDPVSGRLFAANFAGAGIDVYDSSFNSVTTAGGFVDLNALAGYSPYNVEVVNGQVYVMYDQVNPVTHRPLAGLGLGYVDVFDTNGNFVKRFATGGALDAPWGITMAPAGFGSFGGDLLIGNFGNGQINAFNPTSGALLGTLTDASGKPIVNPGLWEIAFRTGGPNVNTNALYLTAGINNEADGLFAVIAAVPEPGTFFPALALLGAFAFTRRRDLFAGLR